MTTTLTPGPALLPSPLELAAMESHLLAGHGLAEFDPGRDVCFDGNVPAHPLLTWNPIEHSFLCVHCPGFIHVADREPSPPALQPLLHEPALAPFLSGASTPKERLEVALRVLRGDYGRLLLRESQRKQRMQTARKSPPKVAEKRANCQSFLLETYAALGNVEKTIQTLVDLRTSSPGGYYEITRTNFPVTRDTLKGYWREIPPEHRQQAKARYEQSQAAKRAARERNGLEP